MTPKITISVLMATYNTDFFLIKRAIDSVLVQDFQNFELIIIDDGSHSDQQTRLLHYIKQYETKITYIYHTNCGQSQSINRGVLRSIGDYITIIDADDEYKPHHLSACLKSMQYYDLISSTAETIVDTEADYYVPDQFDHKQLIHVDDCVLFATLFGRKTVFRDLKFSDKYAADADFYHRASQKYLVKKINLKSYIYYRNIPNSISATVKRQNAVLS
jgi:glycosyltransferase involved in cell wall biosynthesis